MTTIDELITNLKKYASNNYCYVYEGEVAGIVIIDANYNRIGFISCHDSDIQIKNNGI